MNLTKKRQRQILFLLISIFPAAVIISVVFLFPIYNCVGDLNNAVDCETKLKTSSVVTRLAQGSMFFATIGLVALGIYAHNNRKSK